MKYRATLLFACIQLFSPLLLAGQKQCRQDVIKVTVEILSAKLDSGHLDLSVRLVNWSCPTVYIDRQELDETRAHYRVEAGLLQVRTTVPRARLSSVFNSPGNLLALSSLQPFDTHFIGGVLLPEIVQAKPKRVSLNMIWMTARQMLS